MYIIHLTMKLNLLTILEYKNVEFDKTLWDIASYVNFILCVGPPLIYDSFPGLYT